MVRLDVDFRVTHMPSLLPDAEFLPLPTALATAPVVDVRAAEAWLAPYAMRSADSAGRRHRQAEAPYVSCYQSDRDRIIHSAAFRRLSAKTQVFMGEPGDYHRTRLTHTMEVASIARRLGRALALNEDLIEALALAHDLGHPPFGHSGEVTLNECLASVGGFSHNQHGLRLVDELEQYHPDFPGLNLTWEVLEGQASRAMKAQPRGGSLVEVQVVEAADSLTYDLHDADDALELGLLSLDDLGEVALWRRAAERVMQRYADLDDRACRRAILAELLQWQVEDLLASSRPRLAQVISSEQARRERDSLIVASEEVAGMKRELEAFLHERVYRHPEVWRRRLLFQRQLRELFTALVDAPERLPAGFRSRLPHDGLPRTVGDYIAGMTDRYALACHTRFCGGTAVN